MLLTRGIQGSDINLKQLRFFVKVAETGTITGASEKLNLAQTALGQQMRHLEKSLGVQLLVRHSRGIALTESGKVLYRYALDILRTVDEARREVLHTGGGGEEVLRLGLTPSVQALIGSELIEAARAALPQLTLHVVEELSFKLVDALERGELTFAIASEATFPRGVKGRALIEEDLLFVTGPEREYPDGPVQFQDVVRSTLALVSERDSIWRIVHGAAEKLALDVNVAFKVQSIPAIKALVTKGAATSIVPYGIVAEEIRQGLVRAHPITRPSLKRTLFLIQRAEWSLLAEESEFMDVLKRMLCRMAEQLGPHASLVDDGFHLASADRD